MRRYIYSPLRLNDATHILKDWQGYLSTLMNVKIIQESLWRGRMGEKLQGEYIYIERESNCG
jgi:hypothetical protein